MGQFKDITIKEVIEEINVSYFLPDIQREYVWLDRAAEKKIEQLFDSILRNYPIGSFLFWKLRKTDVETDKSALPDSDKLNFQLYQFIEDYDVRNPHNEKIDIAKVNSNDLNIVLDGQQRLTSLYIGLKGSRTLKKPKGWWDNPNAFELKKLYLNLRYQPSEEDTEDCYQFEFKNSAQIPSSDKNNFWFKVGDILNLKNFNKTNIHSIEQNWEKIVISITDAVRIVEDFGYSGQLASGYIISIIALYLYRNDIVYNKLGNVDKEAMFKFVRTAQITSYFTTSLDRKLSYALEGMNGVKDFSKFNVRMAKMDANKALKVTIDDVEDLLTLQYGNPAVLPVLQVLYPHLDYKNSKFHIDHIYPKAKFTIKNKDLSPDFIEEKNYLFNLQLLEGAENIGKKDADPNVS